MNETKQAVGADIAMAANQLVGGMQHMAGGVKLRAGHALAHHAEDLKQRMVGAVADRVAGQFAPHVEHVMSPQGLGEVMARPEIQQVVKQHLDQVNPLDMLFGRRKSAAEDPHAAYMDKLASRADVTAMGMGLGATVGAANARLFPAEFKTTPRTPDEEKRDLLLGAAAGTGLGAVSGFAMGTPGFETAYQASSAMRSSPFRKAIEFLPRVLKKHANTPFSIFGSAPDQQYDKETHAKLVRAKAQLSRAKLVNSPGFVKLTPAAQKQIMKAHDRVHQTIEDAVLSGKYGGL